MTAPQTEATAIVHRGLADVLRWLGETRVHEHRPRHAKPEFAVITAGGICRLAWVA